MLDLIIWRWSMLPPIKRLLDQVAIGCVWRITPTGLRKWNVITGTRVFCNKPFARRPSKQEFKKISAHIPSAIALQLTCLKQAMISAPFKNFSVTRMSKPQWSIPMCSTAGRKPCAARQMNKVVCSRSALVCGFHPYMDFFEQYQILLKSCYLTKLFWWGTSMTSEEILIQRANESLRAGKIMVNENLPNIAASRAY